MDDFQSLGDTVDRLRKISQGSEAVSADDVTKALGDRGILPIIFTVALVAATPLSGIPGVSVVCGLLIALFSFELIFGFSQVYLPSRFRRRSIEAERLSGALERVMPVLEWLDRHTSRRLSFLFHRPVVWIPQVLCLFTGMAMPMLEVVPFSSSIGAIGVCLLVVAMMTGDGLFFLLAILPYAGLAYFVSRVIG
ncbi:exopolysaccharide biosynthesis protein [Algicella marina]|uniref:Exopolysaccharide biosynthesis protein n=1 Tax=Algicella marina TaxID=2683284 RepID=A0A6P1T2B0_9RHOB|nr:exopolysaccharide biosynthesis protein [Algicella marina]QHQ35793.1 exopolysaccharide biosynthesis protein [Algicella marina]